MYGPTREPITEATPNSAKTEPARTLIEIADKIINATWSGRIDGVIGRSSDVYGPGAISAEFGSSFGGRVFWSALEDIDLSVVGDIDAPRSMSYIDDVASGLIMLGEAPDSAGHIWHLPSAPPITPNELASKVIAQARSTGEVGSSPRHVRGCALYQLKIIRTDISEVQHELHTLDRVFVLNHSNFTMAYGENVTSHEDAIRQTLLWFAAHPRPVGDPIVERVLERLPQVARTSRFARRLGAGAMAMARTSLTPVN